MLPGIFFLHQVGQFHKICQKVRFGEEKEYSNSE